METMMVFDNCNPYTNGETRIANEVLSKTNQVIFDVGCRQDSLFINAHNNEVHFFDPCPEYIDNLQKTDSNTTTKYNKFGLSNKEEVLSWHPANECFLLNILENNDSFHIDRVDLPLKRADEYIKENKIEKIDFLKIDVEGFEKKVLEGFGDSLNNVDCIQFEYGGVWKPIEWEGRGEPPTLNSVLSNLEKYGFNKFEYIGQYENLSIGNREDHYRHCNILCRKSK